MLWTALAELPSAAQPLLVYVLLNFCLMTVEIGYGLSAGSLGLVCDGVHLAINCFGIALSLAALEISKQAPTVQSCFGYDRVHVLAAFSNAVFLAFVSLFLVVEAFRRFGETHDGHADHVVAVASAGLVVNLIGLGLVGLSSRRFLQADVSSSRFGKRNSSSTSSPMPHSSSGISFSQDATKFIYHAQMLNLQSVLLHASCDVLNSVGVIFSSLVVRYKGWSSADPLMALVIAALIVRSIIPLMLTSGQTLLQVAPLQSRAGLDTAIREISMLVGVLECHREHMWTYSPNVVVTTLNVRVRDSVNEGDLLMRVQGILGSFSHHVTIQVAKDHV